MNILDKILEHKKLEIAALDARALRRAADSASAPRDFLAAIKRRRFGTHPSTGSGQRPALIAELKRASPSKGILAPHLDLFQVADIYTQNGASAISVLTDEKFFMGKLDTLRELRFERKSELPLLRKDFTIDELDVPQDQRQTVLDKLDDADSAMRMARQPDADTERKRLRAALEEVHKEIEVAQEALPAPPSDER